ncbi:MAG: SulP family inorganic anion transporter [Magnetococcales bacterium]|nr:SulP family inorganic anion transporter [Magnetococcales bacterium]NGZ06741.1 SulP family inorganic anion transporter [Magnetococcales bacterium]
MSWKRFLHLHNWIPPIFSQLRHYQPAWLTGDLVGGVSACVIMIPSVLAYAELVHMPPIAGIYAALASAIGYALFSSSRQVIAGPDAAIGLLAGAAILPLAGGDPIRTAMLAATLALLSGIILMLAARLRIGAIADFLSRPVLIGYLNGASLILASTQIGKLFAIKTQGEDFFPIMWQIITGLSNTHFPTLTLGAVLIVLMIVLARRFPALPGALLVSVTAIVITRWFGLHDSGIALVGQVPQGAPDLVLPSMYWTDIPALAPAALAIAFLAFSDGILLAQAFADKNRYEINPNRELTALGVANVTAGLFQGFPVSASQSRTSIVDSAGGKSQLAQLIAAGGLLLFLNYGTDLLMDLPKVALAAILIVTALGMLEIKALRELYQMDRFECFMSVIVTVAILLAGVVPGIILGLLISLIAIIVEISRPGDAVLYRLGPGQKHHDFGASPPVEAEQTPGLLVYRLYAPMIFANARHVTSRLRQLVAVTDPPIRWLILDAQAITDMDITAGQRFAELLHEMKSKGIEVRIADAPHPLLVQLKKVGISDDLGHHLFHISVKKAVEEFESIQHPLQEIELLIQEDEGHEIYRMHFRREGSNMTCTCSCASEKHDSICHHLFAVLTRNTKSLNFLEGSSEEIKRVSRMMAGTDIEQAMQRLLAADQELHSAQKALHQAKKELRKSAND